VVDGIVDRLVRIPLVGTIAAGKPIDLPDTGHGLYDDDELVDVSPSMLRGDTSQMFALTVKGNSMIDAMVNNGDIVIMREQKTAENGEMVAVWLQDDDTTTLKYFHREGANRVRLQPANPTMDPIYVDANKVQIQGRVMMVMRQTA
jgi:repressor LexA